MDDDRNQTLNELAEQLGFVCNNHQLLNQALTHRSFLNENDVKTDDNERLEYLGDSILTLIVNEFLFNSFPGLREGEMARIKSVVVSEATLADVAAKIKLGDYLLMGRGEIASGGAAKPSILADALEALIAAVYLQSNLDTVRTLLLLLFKKKIEDTRGAARDPKSRLQEYVQRTIHQTPDYEIITSSGPEHLKSFRCRVTIDGKEMGQGSGSTRKNAEKAAAEMALSDISDESDEYDKI